MKFRIPIIFFIILNFISQTFEQILTCHKQIPFGNFDFYPYIHSFSLSNTKNSISQYRVQFSICGNPVYCINDQKFKKGAAVLYTQKECYVLIEWDSEIMRENLNYIKPNSLSENPKFQINMEISEKNDIATNIKIIMECDKNNKKGSSNYVYLKESNLMMNLYGNEFCPIYDEINVIQFFNQNSIFFGTLGVIIAFYIGFMGFHNMKITFWLLNSSVITLIFLIIYYESFLPQIHDFSLTNYKFILICIFGIFFGILMSRFSKINWLLIGLCFAIMIYLNVYVTFGIYYLFYESPQWILLFPMIIMSLTIGIYVAKKLSIMDDLKIIKTRIFVLTFTFGLLAAYLITRSIILMADPNLYPNEFSIAYYKNLYPKIENPYLYGWGMQIFFNLIFILFNFRQATLFELDNLSNYYELV